MCGIVVVGPNAQRIGYSTKGLQHMPKVGATRTKVQAKVKATGTKAKGKAKATPQTFATLKVLPTAQLLALRASTPRPNLKLHYAIRRALRAGGYYISQNR